MAELISIIDVKDEDVTDKRFTTTRVQRQESSRHDVETFQEQGSVIEDDVSTPASTDPSRIRINDLFSDVDLFWDMSMTSVSDDRNWWIKMSKGQPRF